MIQRKGEWLLLVEDDQEISVLLQAILEGNNYNVIPAADGEEAEKIYKTHEPKIDLIISDLGLPKLGGVELFEKLFLINPRLKFIASSGYESKDLSDDLLKKGIKAFIAKPYSPEVLLKIVREVIDSN